MPYRSVTRDGVTLLCFPPHDLVFAGHAAHTLGTLDRADPGALQAALQAAYPGAVVRARESLAALGGGVAWYAYRDGRYSPFTEADRWWEADDVAYLVIDAEGRYVDANQPALELIGMDITALRSMSTGELTDPAARPTVTWIWALLEDVGTLHSTSILVTPEGRRVPVEYRLVRDGMSEGRSVSFLRRVPIDAVAASDPVASPDPVAAPDPESVPDRESPRDPVAASGPAVSSGAAPSSDAESSPDPLASPRSR
jgi:PAS domain-containing protein